MQKWLKKITEGTTGGIGQDWCYFKDGQWQKLFTHHATGDQEVIDYLFCDGATEVIKVDMINSAGTCEGVHYSRSENFSCPIDQYDI